MLRFHQDARAKHSKSNARIKGKASARDLVARLHNAPLSERLCPKSETHLSLAALPSGVSASFFDNSATTLSTEFLCSPFSVAEPATPVAASRCGGCVELERATTEPCAFCSFSARSAICPTAYARF